jgi:hypothetical protein
MFVHALLSTVNTASPLSCFYLEAEDTLYIYVLHLKWLMEKMCYIRACRF